jgi:hypothetical protein
LKKASVPVVICTILILCCGASGQKRRRSTQSSYAAKTAAEVKAGRDRVASQIKILTQFLYVFGGVTKDVQAAAATSDAAPGASQQNQRSKARIIQSISDVHHGLQQLESYFGSSPILKKYYNSLQGIGAIGDTAQRAAAAGKFDDAGKSLLKAVDQMTDALAAMH